MPKTELISSREVCDLLDIDRSTLSRWVTAGKVTPAMRVGGSNAFLFKRSDIDALNAGSGSTSADSGSAA